MEDLYSVNLSMGLILLSQGIYMIIVIFDY